MISMVSKISKWWGTRVEQHCKIKLMIGLAFKFSVDSDWDVFRPAYKNFYNMVG